jgi:hypothetical protein
LVYFGYPRAHEDDAQRAVRAGLGMVEAMAQLDAHLAQERGVQLAVRLGIHTGLVVVGEIGGGARHEQLALGETPNVAARLQGMAAPNTVGVSAATFPLLGGFFACQSLGMPRLKGVRQSLEVYQVLSESMARSRLEAVGSTGLTPLVGRQQEVGLLLERAVPRFAALLSIPLGAHYASLELSPEQQKQRTLHALLTILLRIAAQQPVLFIMEDLHWVAPSTLEWLTLLVGRGPTARILALFTCRPDFSPPWTGRAHLTRVTLNRLPRRQAAELTDRVAHGKPLTPLAIPTTLHDSLMARLDHLATVKGLVQLGATLGREFAYDLLHAVPPWDEDTLHQGLHHLVAAEFLYQRGVPPQATYTFKPALIQDVAYQSLLRSTRQRYHQHIAQVLETRFPETVETQPELVAYYYTEAGLSAQAIPYWQRAGQHASNRSAHLEAVSHCTTGIELLKTLPETPAHTQHALTLHVALGAALLITKGQAAPEVEHAYTQARTLCQQVGETPELVPVLFGLRRFYVARPQLHTTRERGETLLRLAHRGHDPALTVIAHYALGVAWWWLGALPAARQHLEDGIARYTPDQCRAPVLRIGHDLGVGCRGFAAPTLWLLGYPAQALARIDDGLALAHELSHPSSLAYARCWEAMVSQLRRDVPAVHEHAEAAVALSTEQGFPVWTALGTSLRGRALAMQGQSEEGMAQVRQGITALRATGHALAVPFLCTLLADVADHLGRTADGLQALAEASTLVEQQEERFWEAEVCRLKGVLLLKQTRTSQAEAAA